MKKIKNQFTPYEPGSLLMWGRALVEVVGSNDRDDRLRVYDVRVIKGAKYRKPGERGYAFHKDLELTTKQKKNDE